MDGSCLDARSFTPIEQKTRLDVNRALCSAHSLIFSLAQLLRQVTHRDLFLDLDDLSNNITQYIIQSNNNIERVTCNSFENNNSNNDADRCTKNSMWEISRTENIATGRT